MTSKRLAQGSAKESEAKLRGGYIMRLADDRYAAALQFIYRTVDIFDTKTHVVPSRQLVARTKIRIGWAIVCAGSGEKLKAETIVRSGGYKSECEAGERRGMPHSEVKLFGVPGKCGIKVRNAKGQVLDFQEAKDLEVSAAGVVIDVSIVFSFCGVLKKPVNLFDTVSLLKFPITTPSL